MEEVERSSDEEEEEQEEVSSSDSEESIGELLEKYYPTEEQILSSSFSDLKRGTEDLISVPKAKKMRKKKKKKKEDEEDKEEGLASRGDEETEGGNEKKRRKKKKKNTDASEEGEGKEMEDNTSSQDMLTAVQVRKYFGSEARETFHKKVNWLNKQCAANEDILGSQPKKTGPLKRRKPYMKSVKELPALNFQGKAPQPKKQRPRRQPRSDNTSFQSMFFEDADDLDSEMYSDSKLDQLSAKEFIKLHREQSQALDTSKKRHANVNNAILESAAVRTQSSLKSIESIRAATPDLHSLPSVGKGLSKVDSPRSKFIVGCLAQKLNPRAALIIRKDLTHEFDLAGMGMGDKMAKEFANSIKSIPVVHRINVEDNNLTDKGLKAIMESIVTLPNLLELNISSNKMGRKTAKALQAYLGNRSTCKLNKLLLRNADVDDFEGEMFVTALKGNKTLRLLDLSQNLIGQSEMAVRFASKRSKTATKAIADHLKNPECCLEILKLSWNSIRLESGVVLAKAIATNNSLRVLDLSYNAIGSDGGKIVGESLYENKVLETLHLANNNIDSEACFVICAAVEHNFTLKYLNLDGNPIGEMGAKSIMNVPCIIGSRCEISCLGCNVGLREKMKDLFFDEMEPFGIYDLDLSEPYQRAVACRVLSTVCSHRTYLLSTCIFSESPIKGNERSMQLEHHYIRERIKFATKDEKRTIKMLHRMRMAAKDVKKASELFDEFDEDHSGEIDKYEFQHLLESLGIKADHEIVDKCMLLVDTDGSGQIELDEMIEFFKSSADDAKKKIHDMVETAAMCVKRNGEFVRFVPPSSGYMKLHLENGFSRKEVFQVITASDQINIITLANKLGDVTTMIRYALQHIKLRISEAINFYDAMFLDSGDKIKVLQYLLPRMLLPSEAQQLISHVTLENPTDVGFLKQSMGNALLPILGTPSGYYSLDLSKEMDRICLRRLMEISATGNLRRIQQKEHMAIKSGHFKDTSSHGNYSFFRNEMWNGEPVIVCPDKFTPMPSKGFLEFDFAGDIRPNLQQHLNVISDQKFTKILINLALMPVEDKEKNMKLLGQLHHETLPIVIDGFDKYPVRCRDLATAKEIQEAQNNFYSNLSTRKETIRELRKKEGIKVDYRASEGKKKKKAPSAGFVMPRTESNTNADPFMKMDSDQRLSKADLTGLDKKYQASLFGVIDEAEEASHAPSSGLNSVSKVVCDAKLSRNYDSGGNKETRVLRRQGSKFISEVTRNRRKLRELIYSEGVQAGAKMKRLQSVILDTLGHHWIAAKHVANLLICFPLVTGDEKHVFGSYKVQLVTILFSRIVDIHNFDLIMAQLSPVEVGCLYCRLGWLNIFNPLKIEGAFEFDMSVHEERMVCKAIILCAMAENGNNMAHGKFQWDRKNQATAGWMITESWLKDSSMPTKGYVSFYYESTCTGRQRFEVMYPLQKALFHVVLSEERELEPERYVEDPPEKLTPGEKYLLSNLDSWVSYLYP